MSHVDQARTAADMALRLSSEALRPWVSLDESKRLLSEALPLVGALEAPAGAPAEEEGVAREERGFVASVPAEGSASEVGKLGSYGFLRWKRRVTCLP